jgi:cellulase/cellobiase CelA1
MRSIITACLAAYATAFQLYESGANPFANTSSWYVNPSYKKELGESINTATDSKVKSYLQGMEEVPSAYWLDTKSKIKGDSTTTMEGILKDASSSGEKKLVTFIVYDLPNRDCHVSFALY